MSGSVDPRGNRTDGPTRPFDVAEDELERAVRETFARRVAEPRPLAADPAGLAIRRANGMQRRRTLAGVALAAVATVAVSTGMAQLGQESRQPTRPTVVLGDPYASPLAEPTPVLSGAPPGDPDADGWADVDLIVGGVLTTAGGQQLALTGVGAIEHAQRLPDGAGWLFTGAPTAAGRSLWALSPNGAVQVLLAGAGEILVARDGRLVAWREGGELVTAGIVGTQIVASVRTPVPAAAVPVGFAGNAVLVRVDPDRPGHAVWRPAQGPLRSGADPASQHLYGTRPDGLVVARVLAGTPPRPCLALLDPNRDLAPVDTACGSTPAADRHGAVSGDGRWLLVNGRAAGSDVALLVDLGQLDRAPVPAGPPLDGPVAWTPQGVAVHGHASGGLVRVDPARVRAGEATSVDPADALRGWDRPVVVTGSEY